MTETPNDDKPGFVAEEPVHCFTCFRLIRPGQTYYLTIEHEVLCADCALVDEVIRVRDDLAVEVKRRLTAGAWRGIMSAQSPGTCYPLRERKVLDGMPRMRCSGI
jgi:hypothetical protein